MKSTLSDSGPAAPDVVWERYMNPALWTSWAPQIRGVEYPGKRLTSGTTGRVHGPLGLTIDFRVLEVDEKARMWTWRAWFVKEPLGMHFVHGVESAVVGPGMAGTRTWLTVSGAIPLVFAYAPVAAIALGRLVRV